MIRTQLMNILRNTLKKPSETMNNLEQQFAKGFNDAYTIAKYEPCLLNKIINDLRPADAYFDGFFSGKQECELERRREDLRLLRDSRNQTRERENEI